VCALTSEEAAAKVRARFARRGEDGWASVLCLLCDRVVAQQPTEGSMPPLEEVVVHPLRSDTTHHGAPQPHLAGTTTPGGALLGDEAVTQPLLPSSSRATTETDDNDGGERGGGRIRNPSAQHVALHARLEAAAAREREVGERAARVR
jgi:hypothetical protein